MLVLKYISDILFEIDLLSLNLMEQDIYYIVDRTDKLRSKLMNFNIGDMLNEYDSGILNIYDTETTTEIIDYNVHDTFI